MLISSGMQILYGLSFPTEILQGYSGKSRSEEEGESCTFSMKYPNVFAIIIFNILLNVFKFLLFKEGIESEYTKTWVHILYLDARYDMYVYILLNVCTTKYFVNF